MPSSSLSHFVNTGRSNRSDFPLKISKACLLIIDVQEYLSCPNTTYSSSVNSTIDNKHNSKDDEKDKYLYSSALPRALPNMCLLAESIRSIRDIKYSSLTPPTQYEQDQGCEYGCEVIFTYLESLTNNCRDISLDYKLSGPKLSKLPSPSNPATFLSPEAHSNHFNLNLSPLQPSTENGKGDILIPKTSCSVFKSTNLDYVLRNLNVEQVVICGQLTDQCIESAVRDAADLGYFVTVAEDACAALSKECHKKGLHGMKGFSRILSTEEILTELRSDFHQSMLNFREKEIKCNDDGKKDIVASMDTIIELLPEATSEPTGIKKKYIRQERLAVKPASCWAGSEDADAQHHIIDALLYALQAAGVEFIRYAAVDVVNSIRSKAIPLQHILSKTSTTNKKQNSDYPSIHRSSGGILDNRASIAEVCIAGLPSYADAVVPNTNLDAKNVLIIKPDLSTLRIMPYSPKTAMVFGTMHDQRTGGLSPLCTRGLLSRVIETAREELGLGFNVGAEIEFCLYKHDSDGTTKNARPVDESLFASTTTLDDEEEFISELHVALQKIKIQIELVHAESASGQIEIVLPYEMDPMRLADNVVMTRETIRACAKKRSMIALFLPKIRRMEAGNGMHLHLSLRNLKGMDPDRNIFPNSQADLHPVSELGRSFIEGILVHLPGLLSLSMPTPNSFRRPGKGCWTGYNVGWAIEDKESSIRVCLDLESKVATNVEMKLSDSTANIYLELAGILSAGMDGILRKLELRRPISGEGSCDSVNNDDECILLPRSLEESIDCLVNDQFLVNILGENLATSYVAVKRAEIEHWSGTTLEEEVANALLKA